MDYATFILLLSLLSTFIYTITISGHRNSRLPPGPYPFPIIGNLLKLGDKPHHSFATLSKRYGPLMSLKLGNRTTIANFPTVVSSPNIAKEFFQTHDREFSSRSVPATGQFVDHHKYSMVWLPVGKQWRRLRRISKEYLFSLQCLDGSEGLRAEKMQELVNHVNQCCAHEKEVHISAIAFTTTLNILSNFIFSTDFAQYVTSSQEFMEVVSALMDAAAKPNLADFFPILKSLDLQGLLRRSNVGMAMGRVWDGIIDQRLQTRSSSSSYDNDITLSTNNDVLDLLLNLQMKDKCEFSRNDMRNLFLELIQHQTHSNGQWSSFFVTQKNETRSEVVEHMRNIIETYKNRISLDSHIYLQAVIKETLRLHPPAPLLVPHQAIQDVEFQGFVIPKNAEILCNVWGMGRDPDVWRDPELFIPERFLNVGIEYKGQDFNLIPFGAGRRICPGLNIAHRILHTMLGSLIHKFDRKFKGNMRPQDMDMEEKFGIVLQRKVPLMVIPTKLYLYLF
ncbi:LOW QUALITY PROTEIN: hypothetical protein OSB04_032185 [Centaurea solstitialis]|uniref:Cytochrome P450 n=1 Tax=Centaurea solstitialis TaxID=347529 RepID=A0AA38VV60_9ASTR|nr:LOW QUALITY PROTEIN: hypothetical protein OSB04_032185 [Centaurea solstitialis]